ncbi:nucleoplasmin-like protein (NLP) [Novymonas esmeraldas]|uniref:Nucleoplasmin-like protein (NLP) n=1 Tax=Novymonas esmeraldas TaxID=1808958 RepID=A0AAW0F572_9TRYP
MITARSPYQVYKATNVNGTVADFNSLPSEEVLPYKITAAEETLVASLAVVESDAAHRAKYAVSTLHAASSYVSHLISYVPLSARSQTAKKVEIHYDGIVRTVMLFATDTELFRSVKSMVVANVPGELVSLKDLSDLEGALATMEKEHRQRAKDAGERVDMLRKVAPEPVVVLASPVRSQAEATAAAEDGERDSARSATASSGQRRRRSQSADASAAVAELPGDAAAVKAAKTERVVVGDDALLAADYVPKAAPGLKTARAGRGGGLVWGRLRALTSNEKKAVAVLQSMIQVLAHVFATRHNDLVPLFDLFEERLATVQSIMDVERAQHEAKEDKKPPEPFHEVTLAGLRAALEQSSHTFRNDEECRYELDEDLLHPIAHACLSIVNQLEGYTTEPFKSPTPEELERKQQMRDAARAKREEAQRRVLERAEAKAELERKKEEERQLLRRRLGGGGGGGAEEDDEALEEDTTLVNPSTLGYVAYPAHLPLGDPGLYERALRVWSMLVSVPRALNLSQMPFATFVKGLECDDQDSNGLMEEVTKCLLDVSIESVRLRSPDTPRIATRGKNWFDALVEFVGVASGTKKRRQQQKQHRTPSTEEEEDDEEEDEEDESDEREETMSSTTSSAAESSSAKDGAAESAAAEEEPATADVKEDATGTEAAAATAAEESETDPFLLEVKATMQMVAGLRSLATWGNIEVADRLVLLQFCVLEALGSDAVRQEADRLVKEREEEASSADKKLKEAREEAERELKALLRTLPAVTSTATRRKKTAPKATRKTEAAKAEGGGSGDGEDRRDGDEAEDTAGVGESTEDDAAVKTFEAVREAILKCVDRRREETYAHVFGAQDGHDDGAVVEPLGMDRHRRLYWRFPLERVVYVQSVPDLTATTFPRVAEPPALRQHRAPPRSLLLDDEEENPGRGARRRDAAAAGSDVNDAESATSAAGQTSWGIVPHEYLATFVQTLDRRGEREAPLRRTLETLEPYLSQLEPPREARETRSRAHMFGYLNRLKVDFSY